MKMVVLYFYKRNEENKNSRANHWLVLERWSSIKNCISKTQNTKVTTNNYHNNYNAYTETLIENK